MLLRVGDFHVQICLNSNARRSGERDEGEKSKDQTAMQAPSHHFGDADIVGTTSSVAGVDLEVELHPVRDTIIFQAQHVLERTFALPSQHDLAPSLGRCAPQS